MHELSIVEALIGQVEREIARSGAAGRVLRLDLSIGRMAGVNSDSVRFAFEVLSPGTRVEGAELAIDEPAAICICRGCGAESQTDDVFAACPQCGSDEVAIEGGRDMLLESIELEDPT
jgi:hydrogenase nickel incorporation protein HypA/HybF